MTINSTSVVSDPLYPNGATTVFPFSFQVADDADILPQINGVDVSSSAYTVSRNDDGTGSITFHTPPTSGGTLRLYANPTFGQPDQIGNQGPYFQTVIERALDRLATQSLYLKARITGAIRFPIGEVNTTELPIASARAGRFLGFDVAGNAVALSGTGADAGLRTDLVASAGAALIGYSPDPTGGTFSLQTELRRTVWLEQYFKVPDADHYNAFVRALAVLNTAGGGVLRMGKGTFNVASGSLGNGLAVPLGVTIQGSGLNATTLQITGTAAQVALFTIHNTRDVTFADFRCIGNKQATGLADGSFVKGYLTNLATNNMRNLRFERLRLDDFGGPYWIEIEANNTTAYRMSRIFVNDVEAYSSAGCIPVAGWASAVTYAMAVLRISAANATSNLTHVRINNFYADCDYIKQGVALNGNIQDVVIDTPNVENAGRSAANDDSGAYGIMCYDSGALGMANITIVNPTIPYYRSCGIYLAAAKDVTIINPHISGGTDQLAGTLPKGAIAANAPSGLKIVSGRLSGNWRDLHITSGAFSDLDVLIDGLTIRHTALNATSVWLENAPTSGAVEGVRIVNPDWQASGSGSSAVTFNNTATNYMNQVRIQGGRIRGTVYGVNLYGGGVATPATDYVIEGTDIYGGGLAIRGNSQTGRITLRKVIARGVNLSSINVQLYGCTDIDLADVRSITSDTGFDLRGATGTTRKLSSVHGTAIALGGSPTGLGLAIPTHTGKVGDFVQNLAPAAGGYEGWIYTTGGAWKGCGAIAA